MSYFAVQNQTVFPPIIPRHYWSPGAIPMSGFGDDPTTPIDPTSTPWWQQAVNWAQQNMPSGPSTPSVDPTVPVDPTQPQPAPAPAPAPSPATSSSNTLLVAGGIALVGVVGLVFLLKEG